MNHKDLELWKRAMPMAVTVCGLSRQFPREEMHGLTSQVRRAAVSIPANLAEGAERGVHREVAHFLTIARGHLPELESHQILAQALGHIHKSDKESTADLLAEVGRLLTGTVRAQRRGATAT